MVRVFAVGAVLESWSAPLAAVAEWAFDWLAGLAAGKLMTAVTPFAFTRRCGSRHPPCCGAQCRASAVGAV